MVFIWIFSKQFESGVCPRQAENESLNWMNDARNCLIKRVIFIGLNLLKHPQNKKIIKRSLANFGSAGDLVRFLACLSFPKGPTHRIRQKLCWTFLTLIFCCFVKKGHFEVVLIVLHSSVEIISAGGI